MEISYWQSDKTSETFQPSLQENMEADVCVIGAGISGMSVAYELSKKGKKVIVLDKSDLGQGETAHTTAHLSYILDTRYIDLVKIHGEENAKLILESHAQAINHIENVVNQEFISCDFQRLNGYLYVAPENEKETTNDYYQLQEECNFINKVGTSYNVSMEVVKNLPMHITTPCMVVPKQAQFHPLHYRNGLIRVVEKFGGKVFFGTKVQKVTSTPSNIEIHTKNGSVVRAEHLVIATNTPFNNTVVLHTKQASYRSYVIGFKVPKDFFSPGLFWDTNKPYHYVRTVPFSSTQDMLLIGGEDHKTGQNDKPEESFTRLETWAKKHFSNLGDVYYHWSGQILEPVDQIAFIGHNPSDAKNIYVVTGHSGNGMTYGAIAGILIKDLILKRENIWTDLYSPTRKAFHSLGKYIEENFNTVAQYTDWIHFDSLEKRLPIDEGVVIHDGLKKIAIYRDEKDRLHAVSAVCTHLGGIVRWNAAEKSWDCPCHGSRFDIDGKVLNGPANENLDQISLNDEEIKTYFPEQKSEDSLNTIM